MSEIYAKLVAAYQRSGAGPLLYIRPQQQLLPIPIQRFDEPLLPFGKALIAATDDIVTGYIFDFPAYLIYGAAGAIALERTIGYVRASGQTCAIVHGTFATDAYAAGMGASGFAADGVTVIDQTSTAAYHANGIFTLPVSSASLPEAFHLPGIPAPISVAGDAIAYTSREDDFAEAVRAAILTLKVQR